MMVAASFTGCTECCSLLQQRNVGSVVDTAAGSLRETKRVYYLKRSVFPEGLKLAPSRGIRHVAIEGSMKAPLCCTSIDTESEIATHENVKCEGPKVKVRLRVDHQIAFGEHVALLGSSESAGSWNVRVMMGWTEDGWVVDLEADPGETIEYKYVILTGDGNVVWEHGENRVLVVPDDFSKYYQVVSHWSSTTETIDFEVIDTSLAPEDTATEVEVDTEAEVEVEAESQEGAQQALINATGASEVVGGISSPENGAIEVKEKVTNETVDAEAVEETQAPEAVVTEPELEKSEGNANGSSIPKKSEFPDFTRSSKPVVKGDLTSTTWWGPVSVLLSILLILYGFVILPKN